MSAAKVYLAASFKDQKRMRDLRDQVQRLGYEVTSTWLDIDADGMRQAEIDADPQRAAQNGRQDLLDLRRADMLVLFAGTPSTTGGKHVEYGYALALGMDLVIVGKPENVFQALSAPVVLTDEAEFLRYLSIPVVTP